MAENQASCKTCKTPIPLSDISSRNALQVGDDVYCTKCKEEILGMVVEEEPKERKTNESKANPTPKRHVPLDKKRIVSTPFIIVSILFVVLVAVVILSIGSNKPLHTTVYNFKTQSNEEPNAILLNFETALKAPFRPIDSIVKLDSDEAKEKIHKYAGQNYTITISKNGYEDFIYTLDLTKDEFTRQNDYKTSVIIADEIKAVTLIAKKELTEPYEKAESLLQLQDPTGQNLKDAKNALEKVDRIDKNYKNTASLLEDLRGKVDLIGKMEQLRDLARKDLDNNIEESKPIKDLEDFLTKHSVTEGFGHIAKHGKLSLDIRKRLGSYLKKVNDAMQDTGIKKAEALLADIEKALTNRDNDPVLNDPELQKSLKSYKSRLEAKKDDFAINQVLSDYSSEIMSAIKQDDLKKAEIMMKDEELNKLTAKGVKKEAIEKFKKEEIPKHRNEIKQVNDLKDNHSYNIRYFKIIEAGKTRETLAKKITGAIDTTIRKLLDDETSANKIDERLKGLDDVYKNASKENKDVTIATLKEHFSNETLFDQKWKELESVIESAKFVKAEHFIKELDLEKKELRAAFHFELKFLTDTDEKSENLKRKAEVKLTLIQKGGTWLIEKYEKFK